MNAYIADTEIEQILDIRIKLVLVLFILGIPSNGDLAFNSQKNY